MSVDFSYAHYSSLGFSSSLLSPDCDYGTLDLAPLRSTNEYDSRVQHDKATHSFS